MKSAKQTQNKTRNRRRTWKWILLSTFLPFYLSTFLPAVDIYLELKSGGRRLNISLMPLDDDSVGGVSKVSSDILQIVSDDLSYSGIFNIITLPADQILKKKFDFPKKDRDIAIANGLDTIVKFETKFKSNRLILSGYCWDVASCKKMFDRDYKFSEDETRKIAHNFAEDIIKLLTGQQIKLASKIAFSNTLSGSKEIWCVDYDGKNLTRLTYHKSISILPKFSNDARYLFYTTYKDGNPDVFRYDFEKRKSSPFLTYQGINIVGSVSPDGQYIIATLSKDGDPELYLFTDAKKLVRRLTYSKGVDTSASFSPNSKEFVFVSERGLQGNPQLYIMDIDGTNLRKITYTGYNGSPCWSPIGDKIVFTRRAGSVFNILLYDIATQKEYQLTRNAGSNEEPSFSPDGRHIVFVSTRHGRAELFTMLANGEAQKPLLTISRDSTNPVWSP
ncbi:MAG: hypothetical protein AB1349_08795 [Elusimicrobiota bacterium]